MKEPNKLVSVLDEDIVHDDSSDPMLGACILHRFPKTKWDGQPEGCYKLRVIYVVEPVDA